MKTVNLVNTLRKYNIKVVNWSEGTHVEDGSIELTNGVFIQVPTFGSKPFFYKMCGELIEIFDKMTTRDIIEAAPGFVGVSQ